MSDNARVRMTKHLILDSFVELTKEKPFNKITLKEVCEKAEINHSTFYRYYKDIYDWREQLEETCRQRVKMIAEKSKPGNVRQLMLDQLNDFMRDREIYQMLASPNFNSTILEEAYSICIDRAEATLNPLLQESAGEG
nr:TetR/AcrR family transcriptional regulator [Lachnospiraceae bacterium]